MGNVERRTRVLIRVPAIQVDKAVTRLPDTTSNVGTGSAASEVKEPELRIDAAHADLPSPHLAPPVWLQNQSGWLAGILTRKSLLALALIVAGAVALVIVNTRTGRGQKPGQELHGAEAANDRAHADVRSAGRADIKTEDASTKTSTTDAAMTAKPPRAQLQTNGNAVGPALSVSSTPTGARSWPTSGNTSWRMPAASNVPAALGPVSPNQPVDAAANRPGLAPNQTTTSNMNSIPSLPDYQPPQPSTLQQSSGNSSGFASGLNAAFRGDLDKIPSTVPR